MLSVNTLAVSAFHVTTHPESLVFALFALCIAGFLLMVHYDRVGQQLMTPVDAWAYTVDSSEMVLDHRSSR